jgi:mono/diheme cytochrome c family protein
LVYRQAAILIYEARKLLNQEPVNILIHPPTVKEALMKPARRIAAYAVATVVASFPLVTFAQQKVDLGKREYDSNCAVCHGLGGKGDGPYAADVSVTGVTNLTLLAKKNNGVFPFTRVYEFIDGTQTVRAHGPRDMPIWGADYKVKGAEYYMDVPYDPAIYVRARILALTEYVYRLQAK